MGICHLKTASRKVKGHKKSAPNFSRETSRNTANRTIPKEDESMVLG